MGEGENRTITVASKLSTPKTEKSHSIYEGNVEVSEMQRRVQKERNKRAKAKINAKFKRKMVSGKTLAGYESSDSDSIMSDIEWNKKPLEGTLTNQKTLETEVIDQRLPEVNNDKVNKDTVKSQVNGVSECNTETKDKNKSSSQSSDVFNLNPI